MSRSAVAFGILAAYVAPQLAILTTQVNALELVWSTGSRDITVTTSRPCTLLVRTTGALETLPREWLVSWTAEADGPLPLVIQGLQPHAGFADVCTLRTAAEPAGQLARVDTTLHCDASAIREAVARYVIQVEGGAKANVKLAPVGDSLTGVPPPPVADSLAVRVNGGNGLPFPPLPFIAQQAQVGGL